MNVDTINSFHIIKPIIPIPPGTQLYELDEANNLIEVLDPYNPSKNTRFIAWGTQVPGTIPTVFNNNKTIYTLEKKQDKFKGNFGLCVPDENGDGILDCVAINNTGLEPTLLNYVKLNSTKQSGSAFLIVLVIIALITALIVKLKF